MEAYGRLASRRAPWLFTAAGVFCATLSAFVAAGAALPVLPPFVRGPVHAGDVAVGVVIGAFSISAIVVRPLAGHMADRRGRRPVMVAGPLPPAAAGALLLARASLPVALVSRLVMGAGEGLLFTAGSAWIVDLAPEERQGQVIGLFGLSVWGGMTVGPLIGDQLLSAGGDDAGWATMAVVPLVGGLIAWRVSEPARAGAGARRGRFGPPAGGVPGASVAPAQGRF